MKNTWSDTKEQDFGEVIENKYATALLQSNLNLLFQSKTEFINEKALYFALKFISHSLRSDLLFKVFMPFIERILSDHILPLCLLSKKEYEIFQNEPLEYIRI